MECIKGGRRFAMQYNVLGERKGVKQADWRHRAHVLE